MSNLALQSLSQRVFTSGPIQERPASRLQGVTKNVEAFRYIRLERDWPALTIGHQQLMLEPGQLLKYLAKNPSNRNEDCFICLNQFISNRAATSDRLSVINALVIDLDFNKSKSGSYDLAYLFDVCSGFEIPRPSLVISTGGGYHAVWLLARRVLSQRSGTYSERSRRFLDWFRQTVQRLKIALQPLGADPAYSDSPNQTVRLPSSWNPEYAVQIELLYADFRAIAHLPAFKALQGIEKSTQTAQARPNNYRKQSSRHYSRAAWWESCPGYHKALAGVPASDPSRAVASFIVAVADFNRGLTYDEALAHAQGANVRHRPPLALREIRHAVRSAYRYRHGYRFSCRRSCEMMGISSQNRRRAKQEQPRRGYGDSEFLIGRLRKLLHHLGFYRRPIIGVKRLANQLEVTERELSYALSRHGLGPGVTVTIQATPEGRAKVFYFCQPNSENHQTHVQMNVFRGSDNLALISRGISEAPLIDAMICERLPESRAGPERLVLRTVKILERSIVQ